MGQIRVPRTETEAPINLTLTNSSGPVSGATAVYAIRDADTPDSWLDFADNTFKTAGWTTRQASLTGSGTQSGLYTAVPGLDLTAITNLPAATDHLVVEYEVTAPAADTGIVSDLILIDDPVTGVPDAVWDEAMSGHTTAGSAGRANLLSLYNDGELLAIHIDTTGGGAAGSVVGVNGTVDNPVDNETDARTLANALGFQAYTLRGGLTLTQTHTDWFFLAKEVGGTVTGGGQDVSRSLFIRAGMTGTFVMTGGGCVGERAALVAPISGLLGTYTLCGLAGGGSITLGSGTVTLAECASIVPGTTTPVIDLNSVASLNLRRYSGGIELQNSTAGGQNSSLELTGGQIILNANNTGGTIVLRGIAGPVTDNSAGATVVTTGLVENIVDAELTANHGAGAWTSAAAAAIAAAVWDALRSAHTVVGSFGESVRITAAGLATDAAQEIRDEILSDSTPFAGANVDAAISSRSDFDETTDPVELLDAGGAAGTSAAELVVDVDAAITTSHGVGSYVGAGAAAIAAAVWDALLSSHLVAGSFGRTITRMLGHLAGRRRLVRGDPWQEEVYLADNGALEDTYDVKTFGGVDIDDTGGANPIDDPTISIAERDEP